MIDALSTVTTVTCRRLDDVFPVKTKVQIVVVAAYPVDEYYGFSVNRHLSESRFNREGILVGLCVELALM